MAGHSQFKNIMHRKGAQDRKKATLFARLSKEISVAAKQGGEDPATNARLRIAIQNARVENLPKDNIERAIKRFSDSNEVALDEMRYEAFAPFGIAYIIETLTNNRNRTAGNIRAIFSKYDGKLVEKGAVSFNFKKVGQIFYPQLQLTEDSLLELTLTSEALDYQALDEGFVFITEFENLHVTVSQLEKQLKAASSVKIVWEPNNRIALSKEELLTIEKINQALEDDDDVQDFFANYDWND